MNPFTRAAKDSDHGKLALAFSFGGLLLALLFGFIAHAQGYHAEMEACALFVAFQIAAIVVGWRFRRETPGRGSLVTAAVLLALAVLLLP